MSPRAAPATRGARGTRSARSAPKPSRTGTDGGDAPPSGPAPGDRIADFSLPATGGGTFRLREARGGKLVLYFYPRDNTPGCTLEGRDFAQLAPRFAEAGTTILGISRDSLESHERFRAKMNFPFALLADTDGDVCRQFSVLRPKLLYGRRFIGIERSTFLIDADGVLRREWRKVQVAGHAREVLEAARAL
jgi:peroxiredoxin Q/BCP